jgi:glycine betaine/proline transport system substrate-binding protein
LNRSQTQRGWVWRGLLLSLTLSVMLCRPVYAAQVTLGIPNWPSVNVTAHILAVIIEENFGLSVDLQNATNPVIFEAMSKGVIDVHPEVWLPNQQSLYDRYASVLIKSPQALLAVQGLCVNAAAQQAGILDVSDLADERKAKLLDRDGRGRGELFIGAPGWASTVVERVRAAQYGYDQLLELTEIDEGLADSQLTIAERRHLPWAGFCYAPHHRFVIHPDLRLLHEPAHDETRWSVGGLAEGSAQAGATAHVAMSWPPQRVQPVFTQTLRSKYPQVAALLLHMDLTREDLSQFSYEIVIKQRDPAEFARAWVDSHRQRVARWLR